jgi:hypothetical protein
MRLSKTTTAKTTKTSKGKKAKNAFLLLEGMVKKVSACPFRQRLCVVPSGTARKGFLIIRVCDSAIVAWARLKGHATEAMEELEKMEGELRESTVRKLRERLAEL